MYRFSALILLAGCHAGQVATLPHSATYDAQARLLEVNCVIQMNRTTQAPAAAFRFTAVRNTENQPLIGERHTYQLDQEGFVPLAAAPGDCPNRSYDSGTAAGREGLSLFIPEVVSASGEIFALELHTRDMETLYVQNMFKQRDDIGDITLLTGETRTIPLPDVYPQRFPYAPELRFTAATGTQLPKVQLDQTNRNLQIEGLAPGNYTLLFTAPENYTSKWQEHIAITVCAVAAEAGSCSSGPDDSPDLQLAAELDIREALYRHLINNNSAGFPARNLTYCLEIDTVRRYDLSTTGPLPLSGFRINRRNVTTEIFSLPPPALLARFENATTKVVAASACTSKRTGGVFALDTGDRAMILVSGDINRESATRVRVEGGYYVGGLNAGGSIHVLELIDGRWQVVQTIQVWIA